MAWGKWNEKVQWRGGTTDYCTKAFFMEAEKRSGLLPTYFQLSYSDDVEASAGTHGGGSVADNWVPALTRAKAIKKSKAFLRVCKNLGGFGWRRWPPVFPDHLHLGPKRGPNQPDELYAQIVDFNNDGNGLSPYSGNDDLDTPYRPDPPLSWGERDYLLWLKERELRSTVAKISDTIQEKRKDIQHLTRRKKAVRRRLEKINHR